MTKASVRAMDAVTEFSLKIGVKVEKFMVAGASKVLIKNSYTFICFNKIIL